MSLLKKSPTLKDRLDRLRDEIDDYIDQRVAEEKKTCPGIPDLVLRNLLTNRSNGCQCRAYLALSQEGDDD